jgi:hypothetical protein
MIILINYHKATWLLEVKKEISLILARMPIRKGIKKRILR